MASQTVQPHETVRAGNGRSQWATDLKYRWPARYRSSWVALALTLLLVVLVASAALNPASITLVTALAGVLAIAAVGQMLIIMLGAIDLSISAIISVAAGIVVHYGTEGSNLLLVGAAALGVSVLLSLVNGVLISVLRLNAVIVTLATLGMILGAINLRFGVSLSVTGETPQRLQDLAQGSVLRISVVFVAAMIVCALMAAFLNKTRFGRQIAAVGSNRRAARALGMQVRRVELATFAVAGLLYGIAGLLLAGYVGTPDVISGNPYQMGTIVVAGIAGVLFTGGPASLSSVLAAALVMQWLEQAMAVLGLPAGARVAIQGVVLVLAVAALTIGGFGAAAYKRVVGSRGRRPAPTTS